MDYKKVEWVISDEIETSCSDAVLRTATIRRASNENQIIPESTFPVRAIMKLEDDTVKLQNAKRCHVALSPQP